MSTFWLKFVRTWTSYFKHVTYIYAVKHTVAMHHLTSIMVKVSKVHELARFFQENLLSAVLYIEMNYF